MVVRLFRDLSACLREFFAGRGASVSMEFVVSIPVLLAVLVLTSEYGRVLQARSTLDNAVADAARYLSRMPIDPAANTFSPTAIDTAEQIIRSRIGTPFLEIGTPVVSDANGFRTVEMNAAAGLLSPALRVIALIGPGYRTENGLELAEVEGLVIGASETVRYFGR